MAKSSPKTQKKEVKLNKNLATKNASSKSSPKKIVKSVIKSISKKVTEKIASKKVVAEKSTSSSKAVKAKSGGKGAEKPAHSKETSKATRSAKPSSGKTTEASHKIDVKGGTKKTTDIKPTTEKLDLKKPAEDKTLNKESLEVEVETSSVASKAASKVAPKKKSSDKKDEFALEDDLVGETDDFVSDELSEYQAELEGAEEEVEEKEIVVEEPVTVASPTPSTKDKSGDIILTDAEGRRYCRVKDCDQVETVDGYCRFHYLLLWKRIQVRKKILTDGKLERYVEELTARYPDKFLEVIRRDLRTEKDFVSAIQEMEIDESSSDNDFEDESSNFIDEVRSASSESLVEDDEY